MSTGENRNMMNDMGMGLAIDRLEDDPKPGNHCHHPSRISPRVQ
ncbi:hypothetical protein [Colwellia sp. BRX8-9]|nr:hypothetical protein [Colwellia sp. BRX8-9]